MISLPENFAIDKASHDWIYILNADERVTDDLKDEIIEAVKDPKGFVGFYVYRAFYFIGRKINYSKFQRDEVV